MAYMSGMTNYRTHAEAKKAFEKCKEGSKLELYKDGTAAIVRAQDKPLYPDRRSYKGTW